MNTSPGSQGGLPGFFVDASGNDRITSNTIQSSRGELPVLKIQFAYTSEASTVPGNARDVKLADIDRDGDLDLVIAQLGREQGAGVEAVGWFNNVLLNMMNPANLRYIDPNLISNRNLGAPILRFVSPPAAAPGQVVTVAITGEYFAGTPAVDFGHDIEVMSVSPATNSGRTLEVRIRVSADAELGPRVITVTNPDGKAGFGSHSMFRVSDDVVIPETGVEAGWELYN
jgi:hypothetical protein